MQRITDKQRGVTNFTYDASGQLRSRQPDHPQLQTEDFSYDPAGNLSGSGRWQFDSLPDNRLVAFKDLRFSYDTWGNLSEKSSAAGGIQRFYYDSENRLIRAKTWQGTTLSSEACYVYDALGRRIGKQVTQDGQTQETKFLWQGLRLLQEQHPQLHSLYLYEPGSYAPLARVDNDSELPEREARVYYFHTDQIGTPQEMTNAEGQVVWRAYYKAWGGLEALSPNMVEQNLRFQGQYHDRESGLYYNTFRYYDPAVGRFTTQDPIGLMGGDNLYQYAPNPNAWVDSLGLTCNKWDVNLHQGNKSAVKGKNLGLDSHHVGQKNLMKDLVEGYDPATAPAMLVPRVGHTVSKEGVGILSRSGVNGKTGLPFTSARDVVARDIRELRRVYPDAPNAKLQELISLNKSMYPEMR